jgi:hypothetical protein
MPNKQRLNFCWCEPCLASCRNSVGNKVNCFVERVHSAWSNCIKSVRFSPDRASGDRKYCDRR